MSSTVNFNTWQSTAGVTRNTVRQVKQTIFTDIWSASGSGTTWYDTGFICQITPTLITSKIMVIAKLHLGTQYWEVQGKITRNGIDIGMGTARGIRQACGFAVNKYDQGYDYYDWLPAQYIYQDSPASTSQLEYKLWLNPYSTGGVYINKTHNDSDSSDYMGCPSSTITLMEIG